MNAQNPPALQIDGIIIPVTPHPEHEYTLTTAEVAAGYGVSEITIRRHKKEHADELLEGKHFSSVQILNAGNLQRVTTIWTKRGVVRLGFFIRSERARRFRDMAEDLVLRECERPALPDPAPFTIPAALARKIESFQIGHHGSVSDLGELCDLYRRQLALDAPADLGRGVLQRAIFARGSQAPILLIPSTGRYRRPLAAYAERYGQSLRTIKRWTSLGRTAGDPPPLDEPAHMARWFARNHKQRAPEILERLAAHPMN